MSDDGLALMRAAQRQVASLQEEVKEGRKQARYTKIQVRVLGAVGAILLAVVGILGASLSQQGDLYTKLHQQQIQSCQYGNAQRASERQIWDSFIDLLLKNGASAEAKKEGEQFKQFIAQVDAPRNCAEAYSAMDFGN